MQKLKNYGYDLYIFTHLCLTFREIWEGPRSGVEGAVNHFGFNEVIYNILFWNFSLL